MLLCPSNSPISSPSTLDQSQADKEEAAEEAAAAAAEEDAQHAPLAQPASCEVSDSSSGSTPRDQGAGHDDEISSDQERGSAGGGGRGWAKDAAAAAGRERKVSGNGGAALGVLKQEQAPTAQAPPKAQQHVPAVKWAQKQQLVAPQPQQSKQKQLPAAPAATQQAKPVQHAVAVKPAQPAERRPAQTAGVAAAAAQGLPAAPPPPPQPQLGQKLPPPRQSPPQQSSIEALKQPEGVSVSTLGPAPVVAAGLTGGRPLSPVVNAAASAAGDGQPTAAARAPPPVRETSSHQQEPQPQQQQLYQAPAHGPPLVPAAPFFPPSTAASSLPTSPAQWHHPPPPHASPAFSPASLPGEIYGPPGYFSPGGGGFAAQQQGVGHYPPAGLSPPLASMPGYMPHHPLTSSYGAPPGSGLEALQRWQDAGVSSAQQQQPADGGWGYPSGPMPHHAPSHLGPHAAMRHNAAGAAASMGMPPPPVAAARPRQMSLGQQLLQQQGWRAAVSGAASLASSGTSSPLHPGGSFDAFGAAVAASEALDDAAAADTALAAAGSLDDGWRADPGALFRSGSVGTLGSSMGAGGASGGGGGGSRLSSGAAGSMSAPGTAPAGSAARLIPGGGGNIWSYQQSDVSTTGSLGLGTSPVARVLFPHQQARAGDNHHQAMGVGVAQLLVGHPGGGAAGGGGGYGLSDGGFSDSAAGGSMVWRDAGRPAAQLLPTEGELLMAMAAPEGQDEDEGDVF